MVRGCEESMEFGERSVADGGRDQGRSLYSRCQVRLGGLKVRMSALNL